jgi:outer membrane protein assembly factor BamB
VFIGVMVGMALLMADTQASEVPMGFRGDGTGCYPAGVLPEFDLTSGKGVAWRTEVPADGCSSPVMLGRTLVLSGDPDLVMGVDAENGRLLWQKQVGIVAEDLGPETNAALRAALIEYRATRMNDQGPIKARIQGLFPPNVKRKDFFPGQFGWALPTPVTDGQRVYVAFHGGVVTALDAGGQTVWRVAYPLKQGSRIDAWGVDASPVLADGVLVVSAAGGIRGLDPVSGATKYQGPQPPYASTPCIWRKDGKAYLVWANGLVMAAADGKVLQQACLENKDNHEQIADCSPVMTGDRLIVVFGNDHGIGDQKTAAYDLKLSEEAVTMTKAWQSPVYLPGKPEEKQFKRPFSRISPVIFGDWVVTAVPGKVLWAQRIADGTVLEPMPEVIADGSPHRWQPSPIVVGKTLLVPEGWGRLTVLDLVDGKPQVRAKHALYELPTKGEPTGPRMVATPLMVNGTLYLRTSKELIAVR